MDNTLEVFTHGNIFSQKVKSIPCPQDYPLLAGGYFGSYLENAYNEINDSSSKKNNLQKSFADQCEIMYHTVKMLNYIHEIEQYNLSQIRKNDIYSQYSNSAIAIGEEPTHYFTELFWGSSPHVQRIRLGAFADNTSGNYCYPKVKDLATGTINYSKIALFSYIIFSKYNRIGNKSSKILPTTSFSNLSEGKTYIGFNKSIKNNHNHTITIDDYDSGYDPYEFPKNYTPPIFSEPINWSRSVVCIAAPLSNSLINNMLTSLWIVPTINVIETSLSFMLINKLKTFNTQEHVQEIIRKNSNDTKNIKVKDLTFTHIILRALYMSIKEHRKFYVSSHSRDKGDFSGVNSYDLDFQEYYCLDAQELSTIIQAGLNSYYMSRDFEEIFIEQKNIILNKTIKERKSRVGGKTYHSFTQDDKTMLNMYFNLITTLAQKEILARNNPYLYDDEKRLPLSDDLKQDFYTSHMSDFMDVRNFAQNFKALKDTHINAHVHYHTNEFNRENDCENSLTPQKLFHAIFNNSHHSYLKNNNHTIRNSAYDVDYHIKNLTLNSYAFLFCYYELHDMLLLMYSAPFIAPDNFIETLESSYHGALEAGELLYSLIPQEFHENNQNSIIDFGKYKKLQDLMLESDFAMSIPPAESFHLYSPKSNIGKTYKITPLYESLIKIYKNYYKIDLTHDTHYLKDSKNEAILRSTLELNSLLANNDKTLAMNSLSLIIYYTNSFNMTAKDYTVNNFLL